MGGGVGPTRMQKAVYAKMQEGAGEGRISVGHGTRSLLEGFVAVPATWPGLNLQMPKKSLSRAWTIGMCIYVGPTFPCCLS